MKKETERINRGGMKGIFITVGQGSIYDKTGVGLKIRNQIKAFRQCGLDVSEFTLPYSENPFLRILYRLPFYNGYPIWKYDKKMAEADWIYLRRPFVMTGYMRRVLKQIKKTNPAIKIILELPTYPYDQEIAHFKFSSSLLVRDRYNRSRLKGIVDRIATLTEDKKIFGIPTIKIINGIDVSAVSPRMPSERKENEIHLCAVALFKEWHAYERLLLGLADYYTSNGEKKVIVHFIGEGDALPLYQKLVKKRGLEEYVFFHGYLTGELLDELYNNIDIGVCSLGAHRKGIYDFTSELKSREYLAKGLPVISSLQVDVFEKTYFPYKLYVPQDESNISIDKIVEFYENIFQTRTPEMVAKEIRKYAFENVDSKKMVEPIVNYIRSL